MQIYSPNAWDLLIEMFLGIHEIVLNLTKQMRASKTCIGSNSTKRIHAGRKKLFNTVSGCSRDDLNLETELSLRITQNDYILWMILRANPMPPFL